jgi:regulator of chromosome condensation (RCC1) repeat-containing protein
MPGLLPRHRADQWMRRPIPGDFFTPYCLTPVLRRTRRQRKRCRLLMPNPGGGGVLNRELLGIAALAAAIGPLAACSSSNAGGSSSGHSASGSHSSSSGGIGNTSGGNSGSSGAGSEAGSTLDGGLSSGSSSGSSPPNGGEPSDGGGADGTSSSGTLDSGGTGDTGGAGTGDSGSHNQATTVSIGLVSACAVTAGGAVQCWGDNQAGELGNGSTTGSLVPVQVTGLTSGVTGVSVGYDSVCALTTGGGVECWGTDSLGTLGNNSTTNSSVPVQVTGLTSGVTRTNISGSSSKICRLAVRRFLPPASASTCTAT